MRKSTLVLTIILSFFFVASFYAQSIQTGKYVANYQSEGYNLNKGEGKRSFNIEVRFEKPYESTPEVLVTINHVNVETKDGVRVRYEVITKGISRDGFIIELTTWDDSKVHELRGNWIAFTP